MRSALREIGEEPGHGVRRDGDQLVLTDLFGSIKAREGDLVRLPGGQSSNHGWSVCGDIVLEAVD